MSDQTGRSGLTRRAATVLALGLLAAGCGREAPPAAGYAPQLSPLPPQAVAVYRIGVHPLHNPKRLMEIYGPIVEVLDAALPEAQLQLEASRNYEEFEKKLYGGEFHFALPNPYQTLRALSKGYRVVAKMADDEAFRGLILVRKDSGIQQVQDLRGEAIAYPAETALAATLLPQYFLHTHGLDIHRDVRNLYVGSQESAILNVLHGHAAAAATWTVPWRTFQTEQPEQALQLEVKWQTPPLVNNSWVARRDVPDALVRRFVAALTQLNQSDSGRQLLSRVPVSAFVVADDATYRPVRVFLDRYSREVGPLP